VEEQAAQIARLEEGQAAHIARLEDELSGLQKDRESVRQRIERLLKHIDELGE
jgi:chromosome segregation ATPase